ncbi:MAG: transposase [Eubacteriaceae bacterium]|nr:transposase [Eubacteriaceae bacterium]
MSDATRVGVDETGSAKGHIAGELLLHGSSVENITQLSMDMSPAYTLGASHVFPGASITFGKFHVVKLLNEALDQVRRDEHKQSAIKDLKGSRYIWLKNPQDLSENQQKLLKELTKTHKKLAKAYQMKLVLQDIYSSNPGRDEAEMMLKKWLGWADRSRLEPIRAFAKTVKSHLMGVLEYFTTGLAAGISESINSRIQDIKRRAKGFANIDNFIAMVYLSGAGLGLSECPLAW